jgi:DNA-binding NarL/FixJ family response regulator
MGGREAVQRLLEIDSNVKAIISSGYSNNPIMSNPGAYGFKGVLSKPYTSNELSIVLNEIMKD